MYGWEATVSPWPRRSNLTLLLLHLHEMFNISSKGIALQQEVYFNSQVNITQPLMSTFYRGEIAKRIEQLLRKLLPLYVEL